MLFTFALVWLLVAAAGGVGPVIIHSLKESEQERERQDKKEREREAGGKDCKSCEPGGLGRKREREKEKPSHAFYKEGQV